MVEQGGGPRKFYSAASIELLDDIEEVEAAQITAWRHFWAYWEQQGSPKFVKLPRSWIDFHIDGVYRGYPSQAKFIVEATVVEE